jgi:hypothetical protein
MKKLAIFLLLVPSISYSSDTPISGTFSNAGKNYQEYMNPTLQSKINLVVTTNDNGQQFFIQCFKGNTAGFGVVTEFKSPRPQATINAGSYCPANTLRIELDYEDAIVRSESGWAHLSRGNIYVPAVD